MQWNSDITIEDQPEGEKLSEQTYIESMYAHFARFDLDKNGVSVEEYL
mgnify:CR=1 FL=1